MNINTPKFIVYTERNVDQLAYLNKISSDCLETIKIVSQVLPFRINNYVLEKLINWENTPADPLFQALFPQRGMLHEDDYQQIAKLLSQGNKPALQRLVHDIRQVMNPDHAGQHAFNRPCVNGNYLDGIQHKYTETVLFFPGEGQTCHSYCTFCLRWQQFIPPSELHFSCTEPKQLTDYLKKNPEVTDVLFTGGDPLVMNTTNLSRYILPLLSPEFTHIKNIRIGTRALTFWPYRFFNEEGDSLLQLLERVIKNDKHLAIMAHLDHSNELQAPLTRQAIQRLQSIGVIIRTQTPLLAHVNADERIWRELLKQQISLGIIPYYMFVARDTGPHKYFRVPLAKALAIYNDTMNTLSGLAKTMRGPVMSCLLGKVEIMGVTEINKEAVYVLRYLQARDSRLLAQPFFAKFDEEAYWFDDLKPFTETDKKFLEMCSWRIGV